MSAPVVTEVQQKFTVSAGSEQQPEEDGPKDLTHILGPQGVHNIATTDQGIEYVHKMPKFTDKHAERKWMLEHLAGAFRVFGRRGYGFGAIGHISVRDPVDPETFWINPLGKHYSLMKVSDLVHVDKNGKVIGGNKAAINTAGFMIHSEIHKARPDVNAACHTHSTYGKAYSTFGKPLEMINQDVTLFYKSHSVYSSFGGIALEADEGERIAKALGKKKAVILQNHGLLTTGSNVDEAAFLFVMMEESCKIQLAVDSVDSKVSQKKYVQDEEANYSYHMSSDPESLYSDFQPEYELELALTNGDFLN